MSEQAEDWRSFRERGKVSKLKRQEDEKEIILLLSGENDLDVEILAPHQIRVSGNGERADFYPIKHSFHDLKRNVRGHYNDIQEILEHLFNL